MNGNEVYQGQIPDSSFLVVDRVSGTSPNFVILFEKLSENKNCSMITAICSYAFRNLTFSDIITGLEGIFIVTSY